MSFRFPTNSSSYLNLGNTASGSDLKPTSFPFSIVVWVKPFTAASRYEIISCEEVSAEGYTLAFRGDVAGDPFQFGCFRVTQYPIISFGKGVANKWTCVGVTWMNNSPGTVQYQGWQDNNSFLSSTNPETVAVTYQSRAVRIGSTAGGANFFKGNMAYFHFYRNTRLTTDMFQQLRMRPGSIERGLTCFLKGNPTSRLEVDESIRRNNATLTSGVAVDLLDDPLLQTDNRDQVPNLNRTYKSWNKKKHFPRLYSTGTPPATGRILEYPGMNGLRRADLVGGFRG